MPDSNILQLPDKITVLIQGICSVLLVGFFQFVDRHTQEVNLQIIITISPFISAAFTYLLIQVYQNRYIEKAAAKRIKLIEMQFQPILENLNILEQDILQKLDSCSDNLKEYYENQLIKINEDRMKINGEKTFELKKCFNIGGLPSGQES